MTEIRKQVILRMTPQEAKTAENEAKKLGLSVNAFFRLLLRQFHDGIIFQKDTKTEGE